MLGENIIKNNEKMKYEFPIDLQFYFGENYPFDIETERLPFSRIYYHLNKIAKKEKLDDFTKSIIISKIENASKRLLMMLMARKNAIETELNARLEVNQYLDPLIGLYEIEVLYHIEAMVLFARSILDFFTYVSAFFLINLRLDSFTKFFKKIMESTNKNLELLKSKCKSYLDGKGNWIYVLSSLNGRSLRDQIAHQTIIKLDYHEISETSDKVYCHINFNGELIPLKEFVDNVCNGVINFCLFSEDLIIRKFTF